MNYQNIQLNTIHCELEQLFESYTETCRYNKRLSLKTIKSYTDVFHTFLKIMPEIRTLKDLHPQIMPEFFKRISTRKRIVGRDTVVSGIRPSTIKTYHNKLVAFF
jgi:site-specific recombinase XerD